MSILKRRPRGRLTPILAEDMADSWSVPTASDPDQVRFVIDRERPQRTTNQPIRTPSGPRRRRD